ncbi:hypothetical protein RHGRI_028398 [Rhododendron griersonianum]|uniref:Uncharacterized protein n=1 Tax=Rhododendron griersonianum TaxID=479676 RepID=A0AAV6IHT6_9ERIC|nr:hypothetical protein RHGRI_028398 [Rhododendron griersonianum]
MVYWTEIQDLVDGRIDAKLKLLKAQLAYTQNEILISELARGISGILHQNMQDIDLHKLVAQEDQLVEYVTMRAGLQQVMAEQITVHALFKAREDQLVEYVTRRAGLQQVMAERITAHALFEARVHRRLDAICNALNFGNVK